MAAIQRSGWLYEGAGNGAAEGPGWLGGSGKSRWQAPWGVILAGGDGSSQTSSGTFRPASPAWPSSTPTRKRGT